MYLVMSTSSTRLVEKSSCKLKSDANFVTLCFANLFRNFLDCFVILRLQNQGIFGIILHPILVGLDHLAHLL